jgi:SAM-dependent methyltransferase
LLRVLSSLLDEYAAAGRPLPASVLDAGCGAGVLGICAARAILDLRENALSSARQDSAKDRGYGLRVHAQDRDELARLFTLSNAALNMLPGGILSAAAEPLLCRGNGPDEPPGWDLILSNIPAKAGKPVIEDFLIRSCAGQGAQALVVIVHTLAPLVREVLRGKGVMVTEHKENGYSVFCYARTPQEPAGAKPFSAARPHRYTPEPRPAPDQVLLLRPDFLSAYPAYVRNRGVCEMEDISYALDSIQGAAAFDDPGGSARTAAKLWVKLRRQFEESPAPAPPRTILIHEEDQGHFAAWLSSAYYPAGGFRWVLSGRNILSLIAARHNLSRAITAAKPDAPAITILPAVEPLPDTQGASYDFIVIFPKLVPHTSRITAYWASLDRLLKEDGLLLIAAPSACTGRFDREKPKGLVRLGEIKRGGFRALGYKKGQG